MLYYIKFKEVKILWGPGAKGWGREARYEGRGSDNPKSPKMAKHT